MGKNPYAHPETASGSKQSPASQERVLLALSGGMASAAAAVILQEQGYQVETVHFTFGQKYRASRPDFACLLDRSAQAEAIAKSLGLPFAMIESDGYFQQKVISPLQENLAQGSSFDPCSSCHSRFQLGTLFHLAHERNIEKIATGHFVRLSREPELGTCLWRAKDLAFDQSFLLSRASTLMLKSLIAPLGHMKFADVEKLAETRKIPVAPADEPYCGSMKKSFSHYLTERAPSLFLQDFYLLSPDQMAITEMAGGEHQFYWGQEEGLERVRDTAVHKGFLKARNWVITGIDVAKHFVHMGPKAYLRARKILLENVNWIVGPDLRKPKLLTFQSRSQRLEGVRAELLIDNFVRLVTEKEGDFFEIAPGDLGILYDKDLCLGSGEVHAKY